MDLSILEDLGLTEIEAKVYIALLELGSTSAGKVIKKTELHKATAYVVLERLIEKGLVSYVKKGNIRFFDAIDPDKLLDILEEKKKRLESILPKLKEKKGTLKLEQDAYIYKGYHGIKAVCESILEELNPNGEYFDFGVSGLFRDVMGKYWDRWQLKKKHYGIRSKCLFDESVKEKKGFTKDYFGKYKFLPHKYYNPTDTMIFNDKIVLFIWSAKPPLAIVVKSKETAEGYKRYFKLLWSSAKK